MAMQVTVNIREETYRYAEWLARTTDRSIEEVLAELADNALSVFRHLPDDKTQYNVSDEI